MERSGVLNWLSPKAGKKDGPVVSQRPVDTLRVSSNHDDSVPAEVVDRDAWELARAGKKQVLERRFGLMSMVGFCCSLMTTWEGTIVNFNVGLTNGGPAGLIWGFLICWVGVTSVFICMGELASIAPTAGGQYHWASILAPPSSRRFISYIIGWLSVIAWVAAPPFAAFATASMLQYLIKLNHPGFDTQPWQVVLIMWAILLIALVLNNWLGTILPIIEILILIIHVLGFLAMLVALVVVGQVSDKGKIFTTFINGGGWSTTTLSFFVGLYGNVGALLGTDGAIHMAEEISNSTINTPLSMLVSIAINGTLGFVLLIVFLLVAGNLDAILQSDSPFPYMQILQYALSSNAGAAVFTSLIIAMLLCSIVALLSSASRMVWSFAREGAIPGWSWLRQVNARTSIPHNASYAVVFIGALLGLINLGSTSTFNQLLSIVFEGFYCSYLASLVLLLNRRVRGDIKEPLSQQSEAKTKEGAVNPPEGLTWGPWRVKGTLGILNNLFGIAYLLITIFFGLWPAVAHPDRTNMSYSVVVVVGIILLSLFYYVTFAKKHYYGPTIEIKVARP